MSKLDMLRKIAQGIVLTIIVFIGAYIFRSDVFPGELLIMETLPLYEPETGIAGLFKFEGNEDEYTQYEEAWINQTKIPEKESEKTEGIERIESGAVDISVSDIVGIASGVYQPEINYNNTILHSPDEYLLDYDIESLKDLNTLRSKFYIVTAETDMTDDLFNAERFINTDLTIGKNYGEPKILIFNTHSQEKFIDSADESEGIVGVGAKLAEVLTEEYAIPAIHHKGVYDKVNGSSQIQGAYERIEPDIRRILQENPSIEMVIDLHRDGFPEGTPKQTVNINGKEAATIMFFNGLTRIKENGQLKEISYLPNDYLDTNLAMSFQMQLMANSLYPGFTRKIYLSPYRYSLHMMPKSLFVEVGSQFNTKEEAFNTVWPLAELIANVIIGG